MKNDGLREIAGNRMGSNPATPGSAGTGDQVVGSRPAAGELATGAIFCKNFAPVYVKIKG